MLRVFVLFCLFVSSRGVALVGEDTGPLVPDAASVVGAGNAPLATLRLHAFDDPAIAPQLPKSLLVNAKIKFGNDGAHSISRPKWPYPGTGTEFTDVGSFLNKNWALALRGSEVTESSHYEGSVSLDGVTAERHVLNLQGLHGKVWYLYFAPHPYKFQKRIGRTNVGQVDDSRVKTLENWYGVGFRLDANGDPTEGKVIQFPREGTVADIAFPRVPGVSVSWGRAVSLDALKRAWDHAVANWQLDQEGKVDFSIFKKHLDTQLNLVAALASRSSADK